MVVVCLERRSWWMREEAPNSSIWNCETWGSAVLGGSSQLLSFFWSIGDITQSWISQHLIESSSSSIDHQKVCFRIVYGGSSCSFPFYPCWSSIAILKQQYKGFAPSHSTGLQDLNLLREFRYICRTSFSKTAFRAFRISPLPLAWIAASRRCRHRLLWIDVGRMRNAHIPFYSAMWWV